ncbi:D-sedoheptulose-7-phosphate isomerase [Leadbettera azotonutricia]|uniref:Phosphoheptose isomerase n=1 Tax=Leadbettera azotonutricia (strain ATCC BAA-888 / DSM 13862 / ZAS-9) TaxID=545695 RepID=F5Y866_LEAAZ|nr:SIS domain-containing protein [Leadbettera azotonutricia]AEF82303.1 phosphoheptose isomerase [Leadbettera azotonutricia ZAS-9]
MKTFLDNYSNGVMEAMKNFEADQFEKIIALIADIYKKDGQIFIAGNGGSAGSANHFVCDFGKNAVDFKSGKRRFRIISVCDNVEKITALGNDIAFDEIFSFQLTNLMNEGDILIVISASGNSPDIVKACEYAKTRKGKIIALSGFDGGKIKALADACMVARLKTYEQIEDIHLVILHMIVCYFKEHPKVLGL